MITFYIKEGLTRQIKQTHIEIEIEIKREMGQILFHILSNLTVKVMQKGLLLALSGNSEANYVIPESLVISVRFSPGWIKPIFLSSYGFFSRSS